MRVALVTGAARGIGAATVRRLVAEGYAVVALDSCAGPAAEPYPLPTPADLAQVVADCADGLAVIADVRNRDQIADAVDQALRNWGRLDAVVAAAAIITGGAPQWETQDSQLELLWDVDVRGVWNTAAVAVPAMLAGPEPARARFVGVASAAGSHGLFHLAGYNVAKHAVVGLIKGLSADLAGTGVTAVAVSPGSTDTAMLHETAALYEVPVADLIEHGRLRRIIEPEEIAATIAFCCSPAGGVLNGSVVHADGGFPA
jgi:SDR family mycofactocin-dependent oxidoreductase